MTFPSIPQTLSETLAAGVQFKVLGLVFPVLRHEVIGPVSNAGLALAMLRHGPPGSDSRHEGLINELESMLLESNTEVKRLGDWLEDPRTTLPLDHLLELCRKLLFSHLLRMARQIALPPGCPTLTLPEYGSRYVILAWLLALIDHLPNEETLHIEWLAVPGSTPCLQARPILSHGFDKPVPGPSRISMDELHHLALHHGWQCTFDEQAWTLILPPENASGPVLTR